MQVHAIPAAKKCARCESVKAASEFQLAPKKRTGLHSYCRPCCAAYTRERRRLAPEKARAACRDWARKNPERAKKLAAASYQKHRESIRARANAANATPEAREKRRAADAKAFAANPERRAKAAEVTKAWREANPERCREQSAIKYQRYKIRPEWTLKRRVTVGLWRALGGKQSACHWFDLLGYTVEELRDHLQRQFVRGMSWQNMGEWHIDHIVPLASFGAVEAGDAGFMRAWSLPNLRPLWGKDNMSKGAKIVSLL